MVLQSVRKSAFFISCFVVLIFFQNASLYETPTPQVPLRNIDTRTIQNVGGQIKTMTPHIPTHDLSIDGRIGVLHRKKDGKVQIALLKPEKVKNYVSHPSNDLVGANLIEASAISQFDLKEFSKRYSELSGTKSERTFICEKTEIRQNPYVCDTNKDCYDLTLINRFSDDTDTSKGTVNYFASVDVIIKVSDPKTLKAKIESITLRKPTFKIGPAIPFGKIAEPVVVGDGRLLIARVHDETIYTTDGQPVDNTNIVYSVYPEENSSGYRQEQCDVRQWFYSSNRNMNRIHPIAHAPYDTKNKMAERYKFARYKFRDSLGNPIASNGELGGSYPWMDREAANLFYTSHGGDPFYSENSSGTLDSVYKETPASKKYFIPTTFENRKSIEHVDRTMGVAVVGFWTYGKTVLLDGLLNNVDYSFRITQQTNVSGTTPHVHRNLMLYKDHIEIVGAARERGNDIDASLYHPYLALNATYLGSVENRLNYVDAMKPVTPKDVVWHFGTSRHTDEIAFDDYLTPYNLIFADMTGAIGDYSDATKTARYYDGQYKGTRYPASKVSGFPIAPNGFPVLFQNAASAPSDVLNVPSYGKPIGDVRLEPIAKGGIHGKGVWLEYNHGISFLVPDQSGTSANITNRDKWYVSVFADLRQDYPTSNSYVEKTLVTLSSGARIALARGSSIGGQVFSKVLLRWDSGTSVSEVVGTIEIANSMRLKNQEWYHLGFEFHPNGNSFFLNGFLVGNFTCTAKDTNRCKNFFRPQSNMTITLGAVDASKPTGVKGWFDEFRVHARSPSQEEKCNFARGTLIDVGSNAYWQNVAKKYSADYHKEISWILHGKGSTNPNYACYVKYGAQVYEKLTSENSFAHTKNLPPNTSSIRDAVLSRNVALKFDQPRPDFSKNHFCLSCHIPQSGSSYSEMDTRALVRDDRLLAQNDPRRQPMQPPRWMRGVVPAHYFGLNKPATTLAQNGVSYEIDQWVLPSSATANITQSSASIMNVKSASAWATRSPSSAGFYSGDPSKAPTCETSRFIYNGIKYEQACGCYDLPSEYYPVSSVGSSGQSCYHKYIAPAEQVFEPGFTLKTGETRQITPILKIVMQNDSNLVIYKSGKAVWATGTNRRCTSCRATFQKDGNFVIYNEDNDPVYVSKNTWNVAKKLKISETSPHMSTLDINGNLNWHGEGQILNIPPKVKLFNAGTFELKTGDVFQLSAHTNLVMQSDGHLVLYKKSKAVWASGTYGRCKNCRAVFQNDGNFVIYNQATNSPVYVSIGTWNKAKKLKISDMPPYISTLDENNQQNWNGVGRVEP